MAKKLLMITVNGKQHRWSFLTYADPQYLQEWWDDELEIFQVSHVIPAWLPAWAFRPWCIAQDIFNFKNPWRGES